MHHAKPRSSLRLVFLIVFLDIVGFSVIFPLFPAMLDHYVALEGPASRVGRLVAWLGDLAGTNEHAVVTLFGGVLGSVYSLLQFLFAPLWGGLSDRLGRRPILLVTLLGTVLGHLLWCFAGSFALLVVSRLIGGAMAGNISTATAVVADTTEGRGRAKGMGVVGMAIGLGFILGPALGGAFSGLVIAAPGPGEAWPSGLAWNPFSVPALTALVLALVNLTWVALGFRETLVAGRRGAASGERSLNPFAHVAALSSPGVVRTNLVYFLFLTAFSGMEFTLTFLAVERLAYTPAKNAWMFVYVGLVIALVNGGLVRRLAPRVGERRLVIWGLALLVPGFLGVAAAWGTGLLFFGLLLMATGSALAIPCLSSLCSRYAPAERQGLALGTFRSFGALSRAIGPALGGLVYWTSGSAAPYLAGAAFLLIPLWMATRLPPVPPVPAASGADPGAT